MENEKKPTIIRLTKEFTFEAAHALEGYDGLCREIHGHSYRLFVTVKGTPCADESNPKFGMVMDFGELKRIVNEQILSRLDHAFVMRRTAESTRVAEQIGCRFGRIVLVDYQPTCENMLADFAARIEANLPSHVKLHALRLHETATSFAEWMAVQCRRVSISLPMSDCNRLCLLALWCGYPNCVAVCRAESIGRGGCGRRHVADLRP